MICMHHYTLRVRRELVRARGPLRRGSVRELERYRLVVRLPEGGSPVQSTQTYESRAKLFLLLRLKQLTPDDPFIRDAPLAVSFFDHWFELDDLGEEHSILQILDNLTQEAFSNPGNDPEAAALRDAWLDRKSNLSEARAARYRVFSDGQVIGWLEEPEWGKVEVRGRWVPTTSRAGKAFAASGNAGNSTPVVVEGYHLLRARLLLATSGVAVLEDVRVHAQPALLD